MSDKPPAAWYLAPIFMGIIGSAIMWYVLKDKDHPDSPKMIRKGWVIGIVFSLICIALILFALMPMAIMGVDKQMQDDMQVTPEAVPRLITEPIQQRVPAPGFEDVPEMIVESDCDPSYPDVCIPPYPPDLDCRDISYRNFYVSRADPHGFDPDKNGIGCESGSPQSSISVPSITEEISCDPSYPTVCIPPYPPDLD